MSLKEKIESGNKAIADASEEYQTALCAFNAVAQPIERSHAAMLQTFRERINDEVAERHAARGCHCRPDYYDDAWFTDTGITMRIDADHPNDIRDHDWSWEEVEKVLADLPA